MTFKIELVSNPFEVSKLLKMQYGWGTAKASGNICIALEFYVPPFL